MKILHILNHVQEIGNGIVNVAIDLSCLQAQAGHTVAVASSGGEYEALLAQHGAEHFQLNQQRTPQNLLVAMRRYAEIIEEFQPDIIHAHMMTGMVLAKLLKGSAKYRIVSTVHNEFQRSAILMGLADRVIAVSKAVAKSMQQRGIAEAKLCVVQNGTLGSPRTKQLSEYSPAPLHRPAITTVAGMYKRKGIQELIEAFAQLAPDFPEANLYLVGEGPDRALFENQANNTPCADRIHFEGFQPQPQCYLRSTDIFVLASHKDPSPLVIPEAREAGCAIVATAVDGIPESLDQGEAGILVPSHAANELAMAMRRLLECPDTLEASKRKSQDNLGWLSLQRVHRETLEVYHHVCQS
jgi:glycosyltransferase involved in cell wall biosynthesis